MISKTRTVGQPGVAGKWKQPAGTNLYRYTNSSENSGNYALVLRDDTFSSNPRDIIRLKNGFSGFTPENTIVVVETLRARSASRAWSTPGATPQMRAISDQFGNMNGTDYDVTDPISESASCDPEDLVIGNAFVPKTIYTATGGGVPQYRSRVYFDDKPTSLTACITDYKTSLLILVPTDAISSTPVGIGNLTLINKT